MRERVYSTVLCEIRKSTFRGREVLYPEQEQFGWSTAASNKDYRLDSEAKVDYITFDGAGGGTGMF